MKRILPLILVLTALLCGCGDKIYAAQTPEHAQGSLQRSFDQSGTIDMLGCITNPAYATDVAIGQDLIDALQLDNWVAYTPEEEPPVDRRVVTIYVRTDDKRFDRIIIKVGENHGSIGIFKKKFLPLTNGLTAIPVEQSVCYKLPQTNSGDIFATVDALAEKYVMQDEDAFDYTDILS